MVFARHCYLGGDTGSKLELGELLERGTVLLWHTRVLCFHPCFFVSFTYVGCMMFRKYFPSIASFQRTTLGFSAGRNGVLLLFKWAMGGETNGALCDREVITRWHLSLVWKRGVKRRKGRSQRMGKLEGRFFQKALKTRIGE